MESKTFGDGELRNALDAANLPSLLAAMAQLTGEDRWLDEPYRPVAPRGVEDQDSAGLPPEVQARIRAEALETIIAFREGRLAPAPAPTPERLVDMLERSLGGTQEIPPEIGPLLAEELGVAGRDVEIEDPPAAEAFSVIVIGAGFSGLCAAIKLQQAGIAYTMIEKNSTVGGTWLENTYPGCGVDTPSHLYSFSFEPGAHWSRYFAKRDELYAYLEGLADAHRLREHIVFDTAVEAAQWDAGDQVWRVRTRAADGTSTTRTANVVISGVGFFNRPAYPSIPGLERFAGPTLHTAQWSDEVAIDGRRVAVIGTGASAMQLVPAIAERAGHITVFQRSPQWGLPNPNYMRDVSPATRHLMHHVPHYLGWYRLRLAWNFGDRLHPALQIDPDWPHPERAISRISDRHREFLTQYILDELGDRTDLAPKCIPGYPPYGKRPLLDNGWFRTMRRDDVTLVTDAVAEIGADRVLTTAGEEFEADVLVLATGFDVLRVLGTIDVRGRSGRSLRETWGEDDARAYLGLSTPDFPNFFFLLGPNTFAGHGGSAALTIELGMRYVMKLIAHMVDEGVASVECRQEVHDAYGAELDRALAGTIWAHEGMTTYYRNSQGRIVIPMPWTNVDYWHMTQEPDLEDFHVFTPVAV